MERSKIVKQLLVAAKVDINAVDKDAALQIASLKHQAKIVELADRMALRVVARELLQRTLD